MFEWDKNNMFFFFKQKTAYEIVDCDWSSDVCSSDLRRKALMHKGVFGGHGDYAIKRVGSVERRIGSHEDRKSVV